MCSSLNQWQTPWKGLVPALRPLTRTVSRVLKNIPVLLLVAGLALPLAACRDQASEKAGKETGTEAAQKSVKDAARAAPQQGRDLKQAVSGEKGTDGQKAASGTAERVRVYALSEPLPAASPEELARAQAIVDYANRSGRVLGSLCGGYPFLIMTGVAEYRQNYVTLSFGIDPPSAQCARKELDPPKNVFGSETGDKDIEAELEKALQQMDRQRESMRKDYEKLRDYVADTSIVDDGVLGRRLCTSIEKAYRAYAEALERFQSRVDNEAARAQDTMLRDHPLRDHVRLVMKMVSLIRRQADRLAVSEPDPASLEEPIRELSEDIDLAEHLPFPMPGEPEMYYRQFLKGARAMLAIFRRGQLESFHEGVRQSLNEEWNACKGRYNAFVDALARR